VDKAEWEAFGEWVDGLRKRAGLQVRELAERAEVSAQWLQEIRHGGRAVYGTWRLPNPKDEALARLARALDVRWKRCSPVPAERHPPVEMARTKDPQRPMRRAGSGS